MKASSIFHCHLQPSHRSRLFVGTVVEHEAFLAPETPENRNGQKLHLHDGSLYERSFLCSWIADPVAPASSG